MAKTLERRKIKGGKYEFFIADNDGNIIEMVSADNLIKAIRGLRILAEKGNIRAKKVILDYEILMNFVLVADDGITA
jgi:hypothetical protein